MVWILAILLIGATIFLSGCKKPVKPVEPKITEILLSVPYEKYAGANWCLPASAAMVFGYYGRNITQAFIANRIIVNGNASTFRLVSYAKELGYFAEWKRKSIAEIEEYLREGMPLIVNQNYSLSIKVNHSRVIVGFDSIKAELTMHDSVDGSNYKISYKAFFDLGFDTSEMSHIIIIKEMM